jgi:hypothetical protein
LLISNTFSLTKYSFKQFTKQLAAISAAIYITIPSYPAISFADSSIQDQLKAIEALQRNQPILQKTKENIIENESSTCNFIFFCKHLFRLFRNHLGIKDFTILKGVIAIPEDSQNAPNSEYNQASVLSKAFNNDDATLFITAIAPNGPPFAAKKYKLKSLQFPVQFKITSKDLLFPYTPDAWRKSYAVTRSISVTCILSTDGKLSTPSVDERFGFALSFILEDKKDSVQEAVKRQQTGEPEPSPELVRTQAMVELNLKSDGKAYAQDDAELLNRIDDQLNARGFASQ